MTGAVEHDHMVARFRALHEIGADQKVAAIPLREQLRAGLIFSTTDPQR